MPRICTVGQVFAICLGLVLVVLFGYQDTSGSQWNRVRWVNDGDTVVLFNSARVRYIGINAPEIPHESMPAERFGPEAGKFNLKLVFEKKVRLEFDTERHDRHGRLLAYVFLEDGTFVNAELVRQGYAYHLFWSPNTRHDKLLLGLQQKAMRNKVGLWEAFRDEKGPYVGNSRSRRFHRTTCCLGKTMSTRNRIVFQGKHDAFWAGHSPCKQCNP